MIARPDYAGRSPAFAGLDQINFTLPNDFTATGCYVALGVRANGRLSNLVSIPVAEAGGAGGSRECVHPFGFSRGALERLDANRTITAALAIMERNNPAAAQTSEGAGIGFADMTANDVENYAAPAPDPYNDPGPGAAGVCVVLSTDANRTIPFHPGLGRPRYFDAGSSVRLEGPSFSADLRRTPGSGYGASLTAPAAGQPVLRAGTWTYSSSSGGAEIAAFRAAFELEDAIRWTNRAERIDPAQPLRVEWAGGPSATAGSELIWITVSATAPPASGGGQLRTGSFVCAARVQDGGMTISPRMLATLPPGSTGGLQIRYRRTRSNFAVPLTAGGVTDGSHFQITDQISGPIQLPPAP